MLSTGVARGAPKSANEMSPAAVAYDIRSIQFLVRSSHRHHAHCSRISDTNVDSWAAVLLEYVEIPGVALRPFFSCARRAGRSPHIVEQRQSSKLRARGPLRRTNAP